MMRGVIIITYLTFLIGDAKTSAKSKSGSITDFRNEKFAPTKRSTDKESCLHYEDYWSTLALFLEFNKRRVSHSESK